MAKKGETKEKILNAATQVFFENGFEATSIKMILDKAHVVTGSFYHFYLHFPAFHCADTNI